MSTATGPIHTTTNNNNNNYTTNNNNNSFLKPNFGKKAIYFIGLAIVFLVVIPFLLVLFKKNNNNNNSSSSLSDNNNNNNNSILDNIQKRGLILFNYFKPNLSLKISSFFQRFAHSKHNLNFYNYKRTKPHAHPFAVDYYLEAQNGMRRLTLEILQASHRSQLFSTSTTASNIKPFDDTTTTSSGSGSGSGGSDMMLKPSTIDSLTIRGNSIGEGLSNPHVIIISQLFGKNRQSPHYHDMLTAIQLNLLNPFVAEYHLLQENDHNNEDLINLIQSTDKLKIVMLGHRLSSGDFMKYCNDYIGKDRVVILTNTDIYFDHSIIHASRMRNDTSLILSRRQTFWVDDNYLEGSNRDHCLGGYVGSHDVYMYRTSQPFPQDAIDKLKDVYLGYYGSENVIMYHTKHNTGLKYNVKNPCETINVWHLHDRREGGGPVPRINNENNTEIHGPSDIIN